MVIYRNLDEIKPITGSILTIGTFDGLHRGHQEIIKQVVVRAQSKGAEAVLITFDPHPKHILYPSRNKVPLIINIEKKLSLLKELKVGTVVIIPFTREFSKTTAKSFMDNVVMRKFNPDHIIIGYDHHLGYQRKGSRDFIRNYCRMNSVALDVINPVSDEGAIISSTHIRELIRSGFVRRASFELGWVYGFYAQVVHGAGRGKSLTFPTANFVAVEKNQLLPGNGVYLTRGRVNGQLLYGMCNLGVRPTFGEGEFVMEVHFFNLQSNSLYSKEIRIEFLERIRSESKFASKKELIEQLEKDKQHCLELLTKYIQEETCH